MQREIKFRAWDTEKKEMAIVNYMRFDDSEIGLMDSECRTWTTIRDYIAIPMQYTGLHDKNGKEIYEGDIFNMGDKNIRYSVVWHDNGFMGRQFHCLGSYCGLTYFNSCIEVMGNVHEHIELLEVSE